MKTKISIIKISEKADQDSASSFYSFIYFDDTSQILDFCTVPLIIVQTLKVLLIALGKMSVNFFNKSKNDALQISDMNFDAWLWDEVRDGRNGMKHVTGKHTRSDDAPLSIKYFSKYIGQVSIGQSM